MTTPGVGEDRGESELTHVAGKVRTSCVRRSDTLRESCWVPDGQKAGGYAQEETHRSWEYGSFHKAHVRAPFCKTSDFSGVFWFCFCFFGEVGNSKFCLKPLYGPTLPTNLNILKICVQSKEGLRPASFQALLRERDGPIYKRDLTKKIKPPGSETITEV